MPLYEYVCEECNNQFEKRVTFSDADSEQECPACGSNHSRKKISLFASRGAGTSSGTMGSVSSGCGGGGGFT